MITGSVVKGWIIVVTLIAAPLVAAAAPPSVRLMRVPNGGVQPHVVTQGPVVHLLFFTGDAKAGDVQYARSTDGGRTFAKPIRVNSEPASAIAAGTIRGPRLAVGRNGRVHVAWMGSQQATPKGPGNGVPMLYARLNDAGDAFEPQRNVIAAHPGLDGGGTVAADEVGNVYVVWHAPEKPGSHDEADRCIWVARSTDDGRTFAPERRVNLTDTGVCACCGVTALAERAGLSVLYRTATQRVHRDMQLVRFDFSAGRSTSTVIDPLNVGICVMSTAETSPKSNGVIAAWEGRGEVFWTPGHDRSGHAADRAHRRRQEPQAPPAGRERRGTDPDRVDGRHRLEPRGQHCMATA